MPISPARTLIVPSQNPALTPPALALPPVDVLDVVQQAVDLSQWLGAGDTLVGTPVVTASPSGTSHDLQISAIQLASATVIEFTTASGTVGTTYTLSVLCSTALGNTFHRNVFLQVGALSYVEANGNFIAVVAGPPGPPGSSADLTALQMQITAAQATATAAQGAAVAAGVAATAAQTAAATAQTAAVAAEADAQTGIAAAATALSHANAAQTVANTAQTAATAATAAAAQAEADAQTGIGDATAASASAATALTSATAANTAATAAQATAAAAQTAATAAQTAATAASTAAAQAATAAATAETDAQHGITNATAAQAAANAAQATANAANTAAAAAQASANTAIANAAAANTAAAAAQATATSANTAASAAQTTANTANTTASAAQTTANSAQTAATAAQATATAANTAAAAAQATATAANTAAATAATNAATALTNANAAQASAATAIANAATAQTAATAAATSAATANTNATAAQTAATAAQATATAASTAATAAQTAVAALAAIAVTTSNLATTELASGKVTPTGSSTPTTLGAMAAALALALTATSLSTIPFSYTAVGHDGSPTTETVGSIAARQGDFISALSYENSSVAPLTYFTAASAAAATAAGVAGTKVVSPTILWQAILNDLGAKGNAQTTAHPVWVQFPPGIHEITNDLTIPAGNPRINLWCYGVHINARYATTGNGGVFRNAGNNQFFNGFRVWGLTIERPGQYINFRTGLPTVEIKDWQTVANGDVTGLTPICTTLTSYLTPSYSGSSVFNTSGLSQVTFDAAAFDGKLPGIAGRPTLAQAQTALVNSFPLHGWYVNNDLSYPNPTPNRPYVTAVSGGGGAQWLITLSDTATGLQKDIVGYPCKVLFSVTNSNTFQVDFPDAVSPGCNVVGAGFNADGSSVIGTNPVLNNQVYLPAGQTVTLTAGQTLTFATSTQISFYASAPGVYIGSIFNLNGLNQDYRDVTVIGVCQGRGWAVTGGGRGHNVQNWATDGSPGSAFLRPVGGKWTFEYLFGQSGDQTLQVVPGAALDNQTYRLLALSDHDLDVTYVSFDVTSMSAQTLSMTGLIQDRNQSWAASTTQASPVGNTFFVQAAGIPPNSGGNPFNLAAFTFQPGTPPLYVYLKGTGGAAPPIVGRTLVTGATLTAGVWAFTLQPDPIYGDPSGHGVVTAISASAGTQFYFSTQLTGLRSKIRGSWSHGKGRSLTGESMYFAQSDDMSTAYCSVEDVTFNHGGAYKSINGVGTGLQHSIYLQGGASGGLVVKLRDVTIENPIADAINTNGLLTLQMDSVRTTAPQTAGFSAWVLQGIRPGSYAKNCDVMGDGTTYPVSLGGNLAFSTIGNPTPNDVMGLHWERCFVRNIPDGGYAFNLVNVSSSTFILGRGHPLAQQDADPYLIPVNSNVPGSTGGNTAGIINCGIGCFNNFVNEIDYTLLGSTALFHNFVDGTNLGNGNTIGTEFFYNPATQTALTPVLSPGMNAYILSLLGGGITSQRFTTLAASTASGTPGPVIIPAWVTNVAEFEFSNTGAVGAGFGFIQLPVGNFAGQSFRMSFAAPVVALTFVTSTGALVNWAAQPVLTDSFIAGVWSTFRNAAGTPAGEWILTLIVNANNGLPPAAMQTSLDNYVATNPAVTAGHVGAQNGLLQYGT